MRVSTDEGAWINQVSQIFAAADAKLKQKLKFFKGLPLFQNIQGLAMAFAVLEGNLYSEFLRSVRLDIFPRDEIHMTKDKYLDYIPIAWTGVNAGAGFPLCPKAMSEMMVVSMLNYQADEYMESIVANLSDSDVTEVKSIITDECLDCLDLSPSSINSSATLKLQQSNTLSSTPSWSWSEHSSQSSRPSILSPVRRLSRDISDTFDATPAWLTRRRQRRGKSPRSRTNSCSRTSYTTRTTHACEHSAMETYADPYKQMDVWRTSHPDPTSTGFDPPARTIPVAHIHSPSFPV